MGKHYGIPVVWPLYSGGNFVWNIYLDNRNRHVGPAGLAFASFANAVPNTLFPKKSLLMHSMGSQVVLNWACRNGTPDIEFDNIFFVAADIPYDVFQKNPYEGYKEDQPQHVHYSNKKVKSTNLSGMLATKADQPEKPKGKIVVFYSFLDSVLQLSNIIHDDDQRLGRVGHLGYVEDGKWVDGENKPNADKNLLRNEFEGLIDCKICDDYAKDTDGGHGYHFVKGVLNMYDEYHIQPVPTN